MQVLPQKEEFIKPETRPSILVRFASSTPIQFVATFCPLPLLVAPHIAGLFQKRFQIAQPKKKERLRQKMLAFVYMLSFVMMCLFSVRKVFLHQELIMDNWYVPKAVQSLASLLCICGMGLFLWSYIELGVEYGGDIVPIIHPKQTIVTSGPYSMVRHPMTTGRVLVLLTLPLVSQDLLQYLPCLLHGASAILLCCMEDARLRNFNARAHVAFCQKAGFLWPHNLIRILLS